MNLPTPEDRATLLALADEAEGALKHEVDLDKRELWRKVVWLGVRLQDAWALLDAALVEAAKMEKEQETNTPE